MLVLSPRFSTDSDDFWRAAVAEGWNVHRAIRCRVPEWAEMPCVYGEVAFCDMMAERLDLGLLEPPNTWLSTLPYELLKRDLWCGTVADLGRVTSRSFVKPANDKVFSFGVYEKGSDVPTKYIDPGCPIIVSEVVAFDIEVRLHLLDGKIVAASQHRLVQANVTEDQAVEQAKAFITPHLKSLDLPSSVVVDVGHVEERGWAFIEANQTYASGVYYQADPRQILPAILRSSGPRALVRDSDKKFLRNLESEASGVVGNL
jgi:hypothetical protein